MQTIDTQAFQLIDDFAKSLLALNNGKKIPTAWTNRLKGKLQKTSPNRPGVPFNSDETREIAKHLTLHEKEISAGRTKHHSPAKVKNNIANKLGINRKKLDRIKTDLDSIETSADKNVEKRKAIIDGMSAAIIDDLLKD